MNIFRGSLNLIVAVLNSVMLLLFMAGVYYPSKGTIILGMLMTIGVFLRWSVDSFAKEAKANDEVEGMHSG